MKTLSFQNGDQMPALGLGTWKSKSAEVYEAVCHAISIGYRHIDCAAIYGNEKEIGQALHDCLKRKLLSREELWVTSKLWNDSHKAEDVQVALEKTLGDLQLEYVDLYLIHWPVALKHGIHLPGSEKDFLSLIDVPLAETWGAMEQVLDRGLVRHLGVSNFSVKKLEELSAKASKSIEMNQIELHPYLQQPEMLKYCKANGIHLTAYSPLGSPDRPAHAKGEGEPMLLEDVTLKGIAEELRVTPAQVLLAWALQREVSVIPKSVTPKRIEENFAAAKLVLSDSQMEQISVLDKHRRYVDGSFWSAPGRGYTLDTLWDEA